MSLIRSTGVRRAVHGALLCSFIIGVTATVASAHGGGTATVHACVSKLGGLIRIVEPSNQCLFTESPLDWGVAGPQGPAGVPGAAGVQGPAGPQGPAGAVSQTIVRRADHDLADGQATSFQQGNVACQPGETAIGGGANLGLASHGDARLMGSAPRTGSLDNPILPEDGQSWTIWRGIAINPVDSDASTITVRVFIICATS